jgi:ER-bound oxygenase mpaB/B'/Rubber oxygenase, catalytic domain
VFPARYVHVNEARARFGDRVDRLAAYLTLTDPLADAVAADVAAHTGSWALFDAASKRGIRSVKDAPDSFRALFDAVERVPVWVDWRTIDRGGELLVRAGPLGGLVLGLKSLVLGYASPAGNKPLVLSGRLQEQAARRLNETSRFVQASIAPGGMHPHRDGWQIALKVRLMHAHVRRMILASGRWDPAWGAPINQHDSAGTSLLFSVIVLQGLRQLGMRISPEDSEAYMHLWRWSGWLMGIDPDLLASTEAEGVRLGEVIAATQGIPDDDSRALTQALFGAGVRMAKTAREQANAERVARFSKAMCRALLGDEMADHLGIPRTSWQYMVPFVRRLVSSVEAVRERVPFGDVPAVWAGTRYWDRVVAVGLAGATAEFALPKGLARAA